MFKLIVCFYVSFLFYLDFVVIKDKEKMLYKIEGFFLLFFFGYEGMYYFIIGIY